MFISHNWSVKRWKKFLSLCLVWSGVRAIVACCLTQLLCFVFILAGILPILSSELDGHEFSVWCTMACLLTYLLVVFVAHELLDLLGMQGYRTFLDTACVDQKDEEKKRAGIQSVTACLFHSETLVVLYSDLYLERLWTVFELSTFLALKPNGRLLVQPVALGPLTFFFVAIQAFRVLEVVLLPSRWDQLLSDPVTFAWGVTVMSLDLLGLLLCALLLRIWGRTRASLAQQAAAFSFCRAKCHVEADRDQISTAIQVLAEKVGLVHQEASLKECISSFEGLVRLQVPQRMRREFGKTGIPFKTACLIALPSMAMVLDFAVLRLRGLLSEGLEEEGLMILLEILQDMNYELCMPLVVGLVGMLSGCARGSPIFEASIVMSSFFLLVFGLWLPGGPLMPSITIMMDPLAEPGKGIVLGLLLLLQGLLLAYLYVPSRN